MRDKLLTALYGVAVFFLIISLSIGLPIWIRPFYYLQINPLGLPEATGYDYATIKAAFDELMNYLTMFGFPFGMGVFGYTESGAAHFADCKVLFMLDGSVMILSAAIVVTLIVLDRREKIKLCRPFGMSAAFISAVTVLAAFVILAALVASDFDAAFVVFHHVFFPGKDNWMFDPKKDEILNVLPEQFFMNCAILIVSSIIVISITIIVIQAVKKAKAKKTDPMP